MLYTIKEQRNAKFVLIIPHDDVTKYVVVSKDLKQYMLVEDIKQGTALNYDKAIYAMRSIKDHPKIELKMIGFDGEKYYLI